MKLTKKYHAHDPQNRCSVGDFVTLGKCAPVSKSKQFLVVNIKVGRATLNQQAADQVAEEVAAEEAAGEAEERLEPPFLELGA
eukprot:SM000312S11987  [mRNA]  locus=s312:77378:77626:+ [translate_table: standard]